MTVVAANDAFILIFFAACDARSLINKRFSQRINADANLHIYNAAEIFISHRVP
jgi:hypothetical protein